MFESLDVKRYDYETKEAQELMDTVCGKLGLAHYNFNFEIINNNFRFREDINSYSPVDFNKFSIDDILMEYRKVKEDFKK